MWSLCNSALLNWHCPVIQSVVSFTLVQCKLTFSQLSVTDSVISGGSQGVVDYHILVILPTLVTLPRLQAMGKAVQHFSDHNGVTASSQTRLGIRHVSNHYCHFKLNTAFPKALTISNCYGSFLLRVKMIQCYWLMSG